MTERPIIFNTEMVKAILEGRKTQTRRVIKPGKYLQSQANVYGQCSDGSFFGLGFRWQEIDEQDVAGNLGAAGENGFHCPYGKPGDRLWVREKFMVYDEEDKIVVYHDDVPNPEEWRWKPSIHMPRWASRINLVIKDVRVERVQDITQDDAYAEGIECDIWDQCAVTRNYETKDQWFQMWDEGQSFYVPTERLDIESFRTLWDSINAKRGYGWDVNPWVWVIDFEVTK